MAVNDLAQNQIIIYPNPCAENISFQNVHETSSCRIFELTGKMVYSSKISNGQQLNLSQLKKSIYNIQLFDKNGQIIISKKIIKK